MIMDNATIIVEALRKNNLKHTDISDCALYAMDDALNILRNQQAATNTVLCTVASEGEEKSVSGGLVLAEWILKHKRSVFLEADISHEVKKDILRKLNHSSDLLH
jgi:hypothetical protein